MMKSSIWKAPKTLTEYQMTAAMVVQVKDTQRKITLRSKEVNDAINHYWELQN